MLPINKKLGKETVSLIYTYWINKDRYYKNEFNLEDHKSEEFKRKYLEGDLSITLGILGAEIRTRIRHLSFIAYAESIMDKSLIKIAYDQYRNCLDGSRTPIKDLIKEYYKLTEVYEHRQIV
jgi:hypothetical protein